MMTLPLVVHPDIDESVYKYVSAQANAIHVLAKIVKALLLINDPQ